MASVGGDEAAGVYRHEQKTRKPKTTKKHAFRCSPTAMKHHQAEELRRKMDNMDINSSKMLLWSLLFHLGSLPMSSWFGNSKPSFQVGCLSKHDMQSSGCSSTGHVWSVLFGRSKDSTCVCSSVLTGPGPSLFASLLIHATTLRNVFQSENLENLSRKLSGSREFILRTFTSGSPMRSSGECCFATISLFHRNLSPVNQLELSVLPPWDP